MNNLIEIKIYIKTEDRNRMYYLSSRALVGFYQKYLYLRPLSVIHLVVINIYILLQYLLPFLLVFTFLLLLSPTPTLLLYY